MMLPQGSRLTRRSFVTGTALAALATISPAGLALHSAQGAEDGQQLYHEFYRPQFHFTAAKNWLNDPNGLVFYKGEYHLFFQHNPYGIEWGNLSWGHAVSPDMLHWTQLDHAILGDQLGAIWSGSAVVDWNNTAGFQTGDEKVIVCIYTSAGGPVGYAQSLAYSNDCGRTWTKYEKNPVLPQVVDGSRDPKVFWHEPSKQWVMALFLTHSDYALFGSPNLKDWTKLCDTPMPGVNECPDFFALPVDSDTTNVKWVFWGGNNSYTLGSFDGKTFKQDCGPIQTHFGKNRYAAQSFSDIPAADGRRIQIAWLAGGKYPDMPFNQQMSVPVTLSLRTFPEGVRLCLLPIKELDSLHGERHTWNGTLKAGENPLASVTGDLFDMCVEFEPGTATEVGLTIRGVPIVYDVKAKTLSCLETSATIELVDGKIQLRVFVDRTSIEIFTGDGRVNMAYCFVPSVDDKSMAVFAKGGEARVLSMDVWELKSVWPK